MIIPPGVYVDGDFSVSAWVYLNSNKSYTNLVSFANSNGQDLIWLGFNHLRFYAEIGNNSGDPLKMSSANALQNKTWTKVTFVLKSTTGRT